MLGFETKKFGFDWGGSLENNEHLRQLARDLIAAGHEVHIIPAAGYLPTDETYFSWMKALNIPWTGFHRIFVGPFPGGPSMNSPEMIANDKVAKMQEIGCHILYDDNDYNIAAVLAAGLEAVKISGNHPIPIPKELGW